MTENEDVLVSVRNGVGILTLNRPKAINSLNDGMVAGIAKALADWETDDAVHTVLLTGAGERGLCAGGDVVALYHSAKDDGAYARRFWYDEYLLNAHIGRYPKPYVALMDGIVMGGGVGVAAHGSIRVVTDSTKMAMPEVGIGFIPDVGGTYLLSRTPGGMGLHAALTGAPFSGADAIAMGFADHFVPHDKLTDFTESVVADGVQAALATYAVEPPASPLLAQRDWIDECYAGETVADIVAALRGTAAADHTGGTAADHTGGTAADHTGGTAADHTGGTAADHTGGTAADHTGGTAADHTGGTAADHTGGTAADHTGGTAAEDAANLIATRSPVSLAVTLEAVRHAAKLETLEDVLRQEYRTSCASLRSHDFVEGIRAQLVDKDRNPQWSPASIAAVTQADVDAYFVPADPDLTFQEENK